MTTSKTFALVMIGAWTVLILGEIILVRGSEGQLRWVLYVAIGGMAVMLVGYAVTLFNLRRHPGLVRPLRSSRPRQ